MGEQHAYRGMFHAFSELIRGEGIKSLYKGSGMSMLRSVVGSGTNLASYSWMRECVPKILCFSRCQCVLERLVLRIGCFTDLEKYWRTNG